MTGKLWSLLDEQLLENGAGDEDEVREGAEMLVVHLRVEEIRCVDRIRQAEVLGAVGDDPEK